MYNTKKTIFSDSWVMFKRCLITSLRNPETLLTATIVPFLLMFLFGTVFGGITTIDNYTNFIVPGIVLQSIAQSSQFCAMSVASDMTNGIVDRFRSMSISKTAVLIGHTGAGVVRGSISTMTIFVTALLLGFRPEATFLHWIFIIAFIILVNVAISLLAVMCGLLAKTPEGSSGLMMPLVVLPYMSSGFSPVESMGGAMQAFAKYQPMTPMIDSIRALTLNTPLNNSLWISLAWCVGLIIVAFGFSSHIYNRKAA